MFIAGIDPGLKGGIAFYKPGELIAHRTPVLTTDFMKAGKKKQRSVMNLPEAKALLESVEIEHVYLELVTAMSKQGVTGMFRFGQNLGQWEGLITGLGLEFTHVRPQVWKKWGGLIKAEKNASVELAREWFPDNSKDFKYVTADEGRAEASLIAKYGWEQIHP